MPIGSILTKRSRVRLSTADGKVFDTPMNFVNRLGLSLIGIPHIWLRLRIRLVLKLMHNIDRNARILDAGCGYGILDMELVNLGFKNITSLDLDPERVSEISEAGTEYSLFKEHLTPVVGSVTELPFDDNHFDVVVSSEVIEHVPDDATMFAELVRVTKPGGRIIITTPADSASNATDYHKFDHTKPGYTLVEFKDFAKRSGATIERHHHYVYSLAKNIFTWHSAFNNKIFLAVFFYPCYALALIADMLKTGEANGIVVEVRVPN